MSVDVTIIISVFSVCIGVGGFIVALTTLMGNRKKTTKDETKEQVEAHANLQAQINITNQTISARLDAIDGGVRDIRADNRGMRTEITKMRDDLRDEIKEIHDEARHAIELAEAAHRRLDRIDAPQDHAVKKAN